jgi:hypothetical protein
MRELVRRRLLERLHVFDQRHAEEVRNLSRTVVRVLLIEFHRGFERQGCVQGDPLASASSQPVFDGGEQSGSKTKSSPFGKNRHAAQMSFLCICYACHCPHYIASCNGDQDVHLLQASMDRLCTQNGVGKGQGRVFCAIRCESRCQAFQDRCRIVGARRANLDLCFRTQPAVNCRAWGRAAGLVACSAMRPVVEFSGHESPGFCSHLCRFSGCFSFFFPFSIQLC